MQEVTLLLFPFVKNLADGRIYIIADYLAIKSYNEYAAKWDEKRASMPSIEGIIPRPPDYTFGVDMEWDTLRFKVNKFSAKNVDDMYTFIVPNSALISEFDRDHAISLLEELIKEKRKEAATTAIAEMTEMNEESQKIILSV